jgi:hypothetical protein
LFTTKSLKPLGALEYHKQACQAVAFAHSVVPGPPHGGEDEGQSSVNEDSDDEMSAKEIEARTRWLLAGGKEGRVSVWSLMDFESKKNLKI